MPRYRILQDLKSIQGAKFFKGEVVEGTPNNDGYHIDVVRENGLRDNINTLIKKYDLEKVPNTTPLTDENIVKDFIKKTNQTMTISTVIGALAGGSIAFFKKQGFMEYMAFIILGGVAGVVVGSVIISKREINLPKTDDLEKTEDK